MKDVSIIFRRTLNLCYISHVDSSSSIIVIRWLIKQLIEKIKNRFAVRQLRINVACVHERIYAIKYSRAEWKSSNTFKVCNFVNKEVWGGRGHEISKTREQRRISWFSKDIPTKE